MRTEWEASSTIAGDLELKAAELARARRALAPLPKPYKPRVKPRQPSLLERLLALLR